MVMIPLTIPNLSWSTFATGARQLVVQEALEMILCFFGSNSSSLTPRTNVASGSLAGAEMTTRLAPAFRCLPAPSRSRKRPVDSRTICALSLRHGIFSGSRSAKTGTLRPLTDRKPSPALTVPLKRAVDRVVLQEVGQASPRR